MLQKPPVIRHYRWHLGSIAWVLHRITGLLLVFYLLLHIWVIHNIAGGPESFNKVMSVVQKPIFLLLEIGLLGTVLYHAFNGLRIIIVEFADNAAASHKAIFGAVMAIAVFLFLVGGIPMFMHFLHAVSH